MGGFGGGAIDNIVIPVLQAAVSTRASLQTVTIPAEVAHRYGMLHGGTVEVLLQPLGDFAPGILEGMCATLNRGECTALVTPLQRHEAAAMPGKPALVGRGTLIGDVEGAVLEAALEAIATAARPQHWESGSSSAFIHVVHSPEPLVILGTTLVAEVLCELASRAGFRVALVDDTGWAAPERYQSATAIACDDDPVEALLAMDLTPMTCVVLMSVAHRLDLSAVQGLRRRPLRYLGMMGNRGRVAKCFATLAEEGFSKEEIGRLHAPIGLNVWAESSFEIAVAILAELI
jgi:xanthine dehydrogenase accessory factor